MKNVALVVFNGELMCFTHVMLYGRELHEKGYAVKIILEGVATKLPGQLVNPDGPFRKLYEYVIEHNLIECVCKACSAKMGALEEIEQQGLTLNGELSGHPSLEKYIIEDYKIITF